MIVNEYARKNIKICFQNFKLICDAIKIGKAEIIIVINRNKKLIKIKEVEKWIECIEDFLKTEKNNLALEIFDKVYLEDKGEQQILNNMCVSRGTYQRIKSDIFYKVYSLCIAKGLVKYKNILDDKINR